MHDVHDLWNDVAGALDDDGVANADITAVTQLLAISAETLNVVLVVQRDVLHDHTANADRLELARRA